MESNECKPFKLSAYIQASLQPSASRRTALMLQNLADAEHAFLIRWSGNTDIDPRSLLNLTTDTT